MQDTMVLLVVCGPCNLRTQQLHPVLLLKVTGTRVYLEITVTRFMQPMPILTPPSTKLVLGSNPFRPAQIL